MELNPDWTAAVASALTSLIAFIALLFGVYQIKSARQQQRESTAMNL